MNGLSLVESQVRFVFSKSHSGSNERTGGFQKLEAEMSVNKLLQYSSERIEAVTLW